MGENLVARWLTVGADTLCIDGDNDALGAEALGCTTHKFRFDDGGNSVEDMSIVNDVLQSWRHAGLLGTVTFDAVGYAEMAGDSDSDGMADWFETTYQVADPSGDEDGDGMQNVFEFQAGTNPRLIDTDNNGDTDDIEDSDGDTIEDGIEQDMGSSPGLVDTDDDGLTDLEELTSGSNPAQSLHPYTNRVLELDAAPDLRNFDAFFYATKAAAL